MNFVRDKVSLGKRRRWITGAEEFARSLSRILGVAKVKGMDSHTSHVSPGKREPKLKQLAHSVQATYFAEGQAQVIYVYPEHAVNATTLHGRIVQALAQNNHQTGVGQSSKEEILIPKHILRRMEMDTIAAAKSVTPVIMPATLEKPVQLTKPLADAYQFVLSLAPDSQTPEFTLTRLTARLTKQFGSKGRNLYTMLKQKGLLTVGQPIGKTRQLGKEVRIFRQSFTVKPAAPARAKKPTRGIPLPKPATAPAAPVETAPSILERIAMIEQQVAYFHQIGLTIEIIDGKINLRKA